MDETHRFLRYVVPGVSFSIEALLLLIVLLPRSTFMYLLGQLSKVGFGGALGAFLGLGGLGFLFSTFHHLSRGWGGYDHKPLIARLRDRNVLQLLDANTGNPVEGEPNRREAWVIVNALWHQRVSKDDRIKGANRRADTLADIVHSTGTARWGAIFALLVLFFAFFVTGLSFSLKTNDILRSIGAIVLAGVIFYVHNRAYRQTSNTAGNLIAEILEDALTDSEKPVRTHVSLEG